jgi:hypothetical protein
MNYISFSTTSLPFEIAFFQSLKKYLQSAFLLFVLLLFAFVSFSQKIDSIKNVFHLSGSASVTNNGISIVPSFSLEKPAAIFMLSAGKNRLSFDPDLRFSLSGRPWSFLFWVRYKLVTHEKFQMNAGTHLGLNHKRSVLPFNGDSSEVNVVRRYLAGELYPSVLFTKNISVGIYYLYSHGLDAGTINNTHFITLNTNFSNIKITDQFYIKVNPQFYYLKLDVEDGFFITSSFSVAKKNFPLSVSAIINKKISSGITGSKDFVWNASLIYSFSKKYVRA